MELLKKYEGAVFFVDILGMTALTNGKLKLTTQDYQTWLEQYGTEYSDQYLAASLLSEFRGILTELNDSFQSVTISQLSDCAFIWSRNITEVVVFASKFMTSAIGKGLLCRGGMTFGEIIETNQNHDLGRFIVGKAVTDAAKLEGLAKGARILIDSEFPSKLYELDQDFASRTIPLFSPFVNPLDYTTYDEFKWYLSPDLSNNVNNLSLLSPEEKILLTKARLKIANQVRCSPRFGWNAKSKEGEVQLAATINFISEDKLLDVEHDFTWRESVFKRGVETVENINRSIDTDEGYYVISK